MTTKCKSYVFGACAGSFLLTKATGQHSWKPRAKVAGFQILPNHTRQRKISSYKVLAGDLFLKQSRKKTIPKISAEPDFVLDFLKKVSVFFKI